MLRRVITDVGRQSEFAVGLLDLLDRLRYGHEGGVAGRASCLRPRRGRETAGALSSSGFFRSLVQLGDEVLIAFPLRQLEERLVTCRTLLFGDAQNAPAQILEALKRENDALTQHVAKLRNLNTVPT